MGIFGMGDGLGNISVIQNAWKYFSESKGTISGIILSCFGGSSLLFTSLADYIINPNN